MISTPPSFHTPRHALGTRLFPCAFAFSMALFMPYPAHAGWWGSSTPSFEYYLTQAYLTAARFEENNPTDIPDGTILRTRAVASQQGQRVVPLLPSQVRLVRSSAEGLEAYRARLIHILETPTLVRAYPKAVAQAQVAYDCWALHQQSEPNADHNLYLCEQPLEALLAKLDPTPHDAMGERVGPTAAPLHDLVVRETLLFDWDSASLSDEAQAQLERLHAALREEGYPVQTLTLQSFADRSGPAPYNHALSQRRLDAVIRHLEVDPTDTAHITLNAYGETHLPIGTADGVREPGNRITTVAIIRKTAQE